MNSAGANSFPAAMRGAIDLGALAAAREQQAQAQERIAQRNQDPSAANAVAVVTELTEQNFQPAGIDRSFEVPVVVVMWSPRSEPSIEMIRNFEQLAVSDNGTWLVASVNVDEQQQIAAAFQIQGVPTIVALIKGQPVPLVQGSISLEDARVLISQVLEAAAANGVSGQVQLVGSDSSQAELASGETTQAEPDPLESFFDAAADAYDRQDWSGATKAYEAVLAIAPTDPDAKAGLMRVELMQQLDGKDFAEVIDQANSHPEEVALAIDAANVELVSGAPAAAFDRLIETIRATEGEPRNIARDQLIKLFELVGQSPEVAAARTKLANALF